MLASLLCSHVRIRTNERAPFSLLQSIDVDLDDDDDNGDGPGAGGDVSIENEGAEGSTEC